METYFKIKKEKLSNYPNLNNGFVCFACPLTEINVSNKDKIYYYYRLRNKSQDEMIVTPIKFEDLEIDSII